MSVVRALTYCTLNSISLKLLQMRSNENVEWVIVVFRVF